MDTVGKIRDNDTIDYYVTVILEDGKTVKIETTEDSYWQAKKEKTVMVSQTESYLGVTSVRIVDG